MSPQDQRSFYYHCDWHASDYVKVMLDQTFGENFFQNGLTWKRQSGHPGFIRFREKRSTTAWNISWESVYWETAEIEARGTAPSVSGCRAADA